VPSPSSANIYCRLFACRLHEANPIRRLLRIGQEKIDLDAIFSALAQDRAYPKRLQVTENRGKMGQLLDDNEKSASFPQPAAQTVKGRVLELADSQGHTKGKRWEKAAGRTNCTANKPHRGGFRPTGGCRHHGGDMLATCS